MLLGAFVYYSFVKPSMSLIRITMARIRLILSGDKRRFLYLFKNV